MSNPIDINAKEDYDVTMNWVAVRNQLKELVVAIDKLGGDIDLSNYVTDSELDVVESNVSSNSGRISDLESQEATELKNIVEDTTPQLGGDLDLNGKNIDFPTTANISDCLDEDNMVSDSATMLATQQSIKKYVDDNAGGGGTSDFLYATLSADQSTDIDADDELQFDTVSASSGTDISLNTTTHQFTLADGNEYKIQCVVDGTWSAIGWVTIQIYDITNSAYVGMRGTKRTTTYSADHRSGGTDCFAVVEPSGDTVYEARIYSEGNFTTVWSAFCYLIIEKY